MKKLCLIATTLLLTPAPASAGQVNTDQIVELFTSQGCSSCPPSNALLQDIAEDDSVLALTYSVEYWDYLGWEDTFADPSFSQRQRTYSTAIGHGRVYTPQMVVNGKWDKPRVSMREIKDDTVKGPAPKLTLNESGRFTISAADGITGELVFVTYVPGDQSVAVENGENGGRTLTLTNVVTSVTKCSLYDGKAKTIEKPVRSGEAYAVILHSPDNGPVLTAATYIP